MKEITPPELIIEAGRTDGQYRKDVHRCRGFFCFLP
jgi:hypothetical protein